MIRKTKYGNKKTVYNWQTFDSKKEADYCRKLDMLKKAEDPNERVFCYERQVPYEIKINGQLICKYLLDFKVEYLNGNTEHVDVKGVKTPVYNLKKKLMKAVHGITIIEK